MSKIKIAELFYSIQGEGRYTGVPSVFLRTFGCNFRCAGFGMPKGERSNEVELIAAIHDARPFSSYNELPLVSTGCDSYASWDPRFKDLSPMLDSDAIVERIMEILPFNTWRSEHLVITGGEPLLGWQRAYIDLLSHPKMAGLKEITFETNGTQEIDPKLKDYLGHWQNVGMPFEREITFSVSPKLSVSGEDRKDAIKPRVVCNYETIGHTYLKFVVATDQDVQEAIFELAKYRDEGFTGHAYLMPVGGTNEKYQLNTKAVAEYAMKHGLRYSARLQCDLFKNEWGT